MAGGGGGGSNSRKFRKQNNAKRDSNRLSSKNRVFLDN
jgi:hypothetical protein